MPSPVGHLLSGIVIASVPVNDNKARIKRWFWGAFFAAAPDMDMFLVYLGVDYFYAHRTFSHSIVVVICFSFLLWAANYFLMIKNIKISTPWLMILSCLLCHIGLDILGEDTFGPKGLMLLYPLSTAFYYLDFNIFKGLFDGQGNPLPPVYLFLAVIREIGVILFLGLFILTSCRYYFKGDNNINSLTGRNSGIKPLLPVVDSKRFYRPGVK